MSSIYHPLGKKTWLNQLKKKKGYTGQHGRGMFGNIRRTTIPVTATAGQRSTTVKEKKKAAPKKKQKGGGLGVRPRKQMQKSVGPLKPIKRTATTKKKQRKKKPFGLY